ncbi:MAG: DUF3090 family protein [Actinomycetota bacterium]
MEIDELGPVDGVAAGAIGQPGSRRFYLQIKKGSAVRSFPCEKGQVAELAAQGLRLLLVSGIEVDDEVVDRIVAEGSGIAEPEDPEFRIGSIGVSIDREARITLTIGSVDEDQSVSFVVTSEQFRAMAVIAARVVAAGRSLCPRCQLPMDPEGHRCPSVNGHHG